MGTFNDNTYKNYRLEIILKLINRQKTSGFDFLPEI